MNFKLQMCIALALAMIFSASAMAEVTTVAVTVPAELTGLIDGLTHFFSFLLMIVIVVFGLIVFVIILALIFRGKKRNLRGNFAEIFCRRRYLMTRNESRFYAQLCEAVGNNYSVHSKVRVEDVISVRKGLSTKERMRARGYVKSRHFDFVLITAAGEIFCAIELDDSSHDRPDRQRADEIKNELAATVGLKLLRFESGRDYSPEFIASQIAEN